MTSFARMRCALACIAALLAVCSCSPRRRAPTNAVWLACRVAPGFDPDGPPDALRAAIERCLGRGLLERDARGVVGPALAETLWASPDSLAWTFRLHAGLRFGDGSSVTSAHVRAALVGGLGRPDHATRAWLLAGLAGIDKLRAGRPLPPLGIDTPDARTLVLHLSRRDPLLLEKLALPGVSTPWKVRTGKWSDAVGVGPYRLLREEPGRLLVLVRADSAGGAVALVDTLRIRFSIGAARARTQLRQAGIDLVWPVPMGLLAEPLPQGFALERHDARPARLLLLVFRADVPPLTKLPARHALAHAINRDELLQPLGLDAREHEPWLPGAPPFDFPRLDESEVLKWRARGHLGGFFHVTLAYDADQEGAAVARLLQGQWSKFGIYAELRPLRGAAARAQRLAPAAAHTQLVESQAPLEGAAAELATLVMPIRGPAVGAFRTGWRTREFDPWISGLPAPSPLDVAAAQRRLEEERVALPLGTLPWEWIHRAAGASMEFHPRFGPEYARASHRGRMSGSR